MSKKIGIIVDGEGDMASLNYKFEQFRVLKTDGPRGHNAEADKIIIKGRKQISMLKAFKCEKIILMLDLEMRKLSCDEFKENLCSELKKHDFGTEISFVIPNRMIENWYLADIAFLSKKKVFLKDSIKQKNFEGTNGKDELKRIFKKEYSYSETNHGPQLFILIRDNIAVKNSPSYKKFLIEVGILNTECK